MKNLIAVLLIFSFAASFYGQKEYFIYVTVSHKSEFAQKEPDFEFPVFLNFQNKAVVAKINRTLQISELELLKGFEKDNLFEEIKANGSGIYGSKVWINYQVYDRNERVLSVKFDQSSCGATCAYWFRYYNFNSGNGDIVQLKDLFTDEGYKDFFAFALKRRIAQLDREIKKLKPEDRGDFYGIRGSYEADDLTDFFIKNNALYLDGENSFSKNQKFAEVEINRVTKFSLSEFKKYLNSYGKSLFGITKDSVKKYRSKSLPQLFQGKIGGSKVLLVLNNGYADEMKAEYVYAKYGKGIFLQGKMSDGKLTLTEKLPKPRETGFIDYVDNGIIEAEYNEQGILGMWRNQENSKAYEMRLTR